MSNAPAKESLRAKNKQGGQVDGEDGDPGIDFDRAEAAAGGNAGNGLVAKRGGVM